MAWYIDIAARAFMYGAGIFAIWVIYDSVRKALRHFRD